MSTQIVKPSFGGRLKAPDYYESIDSILKLLRPVASLRVMAQHLANAGFTSPSGLPWTRERVAYYLRGNKNI
jgi:hypothetical protein